MSLVGSRHHFQMVHTLLVNAGDSGNNVDSEGAILVSAAAEGSTSDIKRSKMTQVSTIFVSKKGHNRCKQQLSRNTSYRIGQRWCPHWFMKNTYTVSSNVDTEALASTKSWAELCEKDDNPPKHGVDRVFRWSLFLEYQGVANNPVRNMLNEFKRSYNSD